MSIKCSLIGNHLTADPGDYMAVVTDQSSKTISDIIDKIADRGSTGHQGRHPFRDGRVSGRDRQVFEEWQQPKYTADQNKRFYQGRI